MAGIPPCPEQLHSRTSQAGEQPWPPRGRLKRFIIIIIGVQIASSTKGRDCREGSEPEGLYAEGATVTTTGHVGKHDGGVDMSEGQGMRVRLQNVRLGAGMPV